MGKRQISYLLFTLALLGMIFVMIRLVRFWHKLPNFPCENGGLMISESTKYYIHPKKVVVRPWLGQHHVYAVFMLPNNYSHDPLIKVNLPFNQTFCGVVANRSQTIAGINAKLGHYLVKAYLQTRTAIKFILTGKINDLKEVKNWQLGYGQKEN